jgi:hypothetical protein
VCRRVCLREEPISRVLCDDVVASVVRRPFLQDQRRRWPQAVLRGRAGRASSLRRTSHLAPSGVCPAVDVTADAVRSYRTVSSLPSWPRSLDALGRFFFCGTFLRVTPTGRSPAPMPSGARTFLPPKTTSALAGERPCASRRRSARRLFVWIFEGVFGRRRLFVATPTGAGRRRRRRAGRLRLS